MANGLNCEYFTLSIEVENKEHKYMYENLYSSANNQTGKQI